MISSSLAFSFFFLAHLALIHIFAQNVSIAEHEVLLNGKTRPWSIKSKTTIKSLIRQKRYHTLSSKVTLVPPYSGRRTFSPTFTLTGCKFPFCQEKHQQSSWLYYKMKKTCSRPSNTLSCSDLVDRSGPDCQHCGLQHFALRLLRQHDAALGYRLRRETFHQHAVEQWQEFSEGLREG